MYISQHLESVCKVNSDYCLVYIQPPKLCQRFILKPETPHIVCMRSISGIIEYSKAPSISSDALIGSSESHDQQQQPSDGSPSKSGSLEHRRGVLKVTDDLYQFDTKPSKATSTSGKLCTQVLQTYSIEFFMIPLLILTGIIIILSPQILSRWKSLLMRGTNTSPSNSPPLKDRTTMERRCSQMERHRLCGLSQRTICKSGHT